MRYTTLLEPAILHAHLDNPDWAVVDCRFSLDDTERGSRAHREAHIPGAVYAHLDNDLSSPVVPGTTGRHPLPEVDAFARTLSAWGIDAEVQVAAYDDAGGGIAARFWWMLRWLGHEAVAVLDGGWPAWQRAGYTIESGDASPSPRRFVPHVRASLVATVNEVNALRTDPTYRLVDARDAARYRGEHEPIDPVAGHIPGAVCAPFTENLDANGCFLSPEALHARFESLLGGVSPERLVSYCGSGVTATHNLLVLNYAGLGEGRLYPGSWSHWITDPKRPIETS